MSMKNEFQVVVAEDEPMILNNICSKIENGHPMFRVAGRAINGVEALELVEKLKPDVLFTDIRMPTMGGIELIREVSVRYPDTQIVVVSGFDDFTYARQALVHGVKDYLLKPVEPEEMKETLGKIQSVLQTKNMTMELDLITSMIMSGHNGDPGSRTFRDLRFHLFFLHFGHVARSLATPGLAAFYHRLWETHGTGLSSLQPGPGSKMWTVSLTLPFGKFVAVLDNGWSDLERDDALRNWLGYLERESAPYPVTICASKETVPFDGLHEKAQTLLMGLEMGAALGKSQILYPMDESTAIPSPWLDMSMQLKLSVIIRSGKKASFRKEIFSLFEQWQQDGIPQRTAEKRLLHLLQLCRQQTLLLSEEEASHLEYEMLYKFYTADSLTDEADELYSLLESVVFADEEKDNRDAGELSDRIEQYLNANFAGTITISDISDKFSFSPSYITKVFKHYKGISPLKYLISLRMEEVKRLIADHPEMSFKDIGTAVGYEDPNYFSRIFKNTTGKSLSEYSQRDSGRESIH
jgi:two-component system response regulator YesN